MPSIKRLAKFVENGGRKRAGVPEEFERISVARLTAVDCQRSVEARAMLLAFDLMEEDERAEASERVQHRGARAHGVVGGGGAELFRQGLAQAARA